MKKSIILVASLFACSILLASLFAFVQSRESTDLKIPTEWYETSTSLIDGETWSWDRTQYVHEPPPWPGWHLLYKRVGEVLFFTSFSGSVQVAYPYPATQPNTWGLRGGYLGMGGPMMAHLMMGNGTVTFKFSTEDIPSTDADNGYNGLRILIDIQISVFGLEDLGDGNYVWKGLAHAHVVLWATEGTKA